MVLLSVVLAAATTLAAQDVPPSPPTADVESVVAPPPNPAAGERSDGRLDPPPTRRWRLVPQVLLFPFRGLFWLISWPVGAALRVEDRSHPMERFVSWITWNDGQRGLRPAFYYSTIYVPEFGLRYYDHLSLGVDTNLAVTATVGGARYVSAALNVEPTRTTAPIGVLFDVLFDRRGDLALQRLRQPHLLGRARRPLPDGRDRDAPRRAAAAAAVARLLRHALDGAQALRQRRSRRRRSRHHLRLRHDGDPRVSARDYFRAGRRRHRHRSARSQDARRHGPAHRRRLRLHARHRRRLRHLRAHARARRRADPALDAHAHLVAAGGDLARLAERRAGAVQRIAHARRTRRSARLSLPGLSRLHVVLGDARVSLARVDVGRRRALRRLRRRLRAQLRRLRRAPHAARHRRRPAHASPAATFSCAFSSATASAKGSTSRSRGARYDARARRRARHFARAPAARRRCASPIAPSCGAIPTTRRCRCRARAAAGLGAHLAGRR